MSEAYQWRGYPWPTRLEGHGSKPSVGAYPNQGLDLATEPYDYHWLAVTRADADGVLCGDYPRPSRSAGGAKYWGLFTPLGTLVAELTRTGGDYLASDCGLCGANIAKCRCGQAGTEGN